MGPIIAGILFVLAGMIFIAGGIYEQGKQSLMNQRLTEALYMELGYKYDKNEGAVKTLYDDSSWLANVKKAVSGDDERYWNSKSIDERLNYLERKSVEQDAATPKSTKAKN